MKAYVRMKDRGGIESSCWMKDLVDTVAIGSLAAFAGSLHTYTNAGIVEYGLIQFQPYTSAVTVAAAGSNVKDKGRCHFQYTSANGETKLITLWIPSPDLTDFTFVEGVGYRMNVDAGNALADALEALTGITPIQFSIGILDYSESDANSRNGNCIQFEDVLGNKCWMSVPQPAGLSELQAFDAAVNPYSSARTVKGVVAVPNVVVVPSGDALATTETDAKGFDSVERRCKVKLAYTEGTSRKTMSFNLAAPRSSYLTEQKDARGYFLQQATGNLLSTAINTLYGSVNRATVFKSGKVDFTELE